MGKFFHKFNIAFDAATKRYGKTFTFFLRHKWVTMVLFVAAGAVLFWSNREMKKGFIPNEDTGFFFANIELIPGASMERTANVAKQVQERLMKIPGVDRVTIVTGRSIISGAGSNYAFSFVRLKPVEDRIDDPAQNIQAIIGKSFGLVSDIADARVIFFQPPAISGFGMNSGFSMVLLDKLGGEMSELNATTQQFIQALNERPEIQFVQTSFNVNYPQYELSMNVERAAQAGVTVSGILSVLQNYIGGLYATDFTKYGKQFRVMIQSLPDDRKDLQSLDGLMIKTNTGQMAPVSQFVTLNRVFGPQSINRYNLFTSVSLTGANAEGYSTGDAINAVNEVAAETLSANYGIDYTGMTREEQNAGSQTIIIFMLSLVFTYFILSAQYESYLLPLAVICSLPFGIMGAYLGQWIFGLENNIYFQISLIMLVGLLAKNAILIVEFAVQRRNHGESLSRSAISAAMARLRPILMTSFAFIIGLLPLVFASGVGAAGNRSVATGAVTGLLVGTFIGLVVIPVLYVIFQALQEKITGKKHKEDEFTVPTESY